ncbi:PAAR domain-containing protein [Vibrio brasiliensis]
MFNNAVTVGTPTSTGGKVLTGSAGVKINNLDVSLLGDLATCTCGDENCRGVGPIMQGSPRNIKIGGKLIAMKDDPVDTGCGNCFVLSSGDAVSLGAQMSGSINMGAGVNIGQGANINMGVGVTFGAGVPIGINKIESKYQGILSFDRRVIFSTIVKYRIETMDGHVINQGCSSVGYSGKLKSNQTVKVYVR